jgi:UDP-3-O-[3-hydroxymyristoyl] glucosamine N-acyltransferase
LPRPGRLTARALAELVGGRLEGDGELPLQSLAPLDRAGADALTFLLSPTYLSAFHASRAGAVLIAEPLATHIGGPAVRIIVPDMNRALVRAAEAFAPAEPTRSGVDPLAQVAPDAIVAAGAYLGPFVVVNAGARIGARSTVEAGAWIGAGVLVGDDCHLGPNAVCYPGSRLGDRVRLKAGAVIGGPGFRFLPGPEGHQRVPHLGACVLEDDVEIGSGSCIDRGSFEDTVIGQGTKIDNLVQVGHNVRLGERCLVMGTTGIAGSCRIGNDVVIAGGVGVADHVRIGDGAVIGAKSVVFGPGDVPAGAVVTGYPARPHRAFLRAQAALYRLAPMAEELAALAEEHRSSAPTDHRPRR